MTALLEGTAVDPEPLLVALERVLGDVAVVGVGSEGRVVFWSRGATKLFGASRVQTVGRRYADVVGSAGDLDLPGDAVELDHVAARMRDSRGEPVEVCQTRIISRGTDGRAHAAIDLLEPIELVVDVDPAQEQLLRYARDIATSRASEREKERELAVSTARLDKLFDELREARDGLEERRRELSIVHDGDEQEPLPADPARGELSPRPDGTVVFHGMVTASEQMIQVFRSVSHIAETDATTLVLGESGTGKELIASALHTLSPRRAGPFIAINCAAMTPTLAESQLFGHAKGAFTGAIANHIGVFAQADRGTLFLDEVAELPLEVQSKLLRALQERSFVPVGGVAPIHVDVRVVAATHRDLQAEVVAGRFRHDLLFRLNVVPIHLPPLRERREDVEALLRHLLQRFNAVGARRVTSVAPAAVRVLLEHDWPGNVRELENAVQHAFALGRGPQITVNDLPRELRESVAAAPPPVENRTGTGEARAIRDALARTDGRINDAARLLGMSRATFFRKRRKHDI